MPPLTPAGTARTHSVKHISVLGIERMAVLAMGLYEIVIGRFRFLSFGMKKSKTTTGFTIANTTLPTSIRKPTSVGFIKRMAMFAMRLCSHVVRIAADSVAMASAFSSSVAHVCDLIT